MSYQYPPMGYHQDIHTLKQRLADAENRIAELEMANEELRSWNNTYKRTLELCLSYESKELVMKLFGKGEGNADIPHDNS